jgi:large subunit ribosomal protein L24
MQRIKKGDEVVVIAGRDKGKRGTVLRRVDPQYVVVEGVNRVKKHMRPNPMKGVTGGIVDRDMPIHGGRKVRVFKANGEQVDA